MARAISPRRKWFFTILAWSVAFIIFFWSQYLHGTSGWLEVMLFIAGVICVAAEIFVLPGFGVLGLGGGLLGHAVDKEERDAVGQDEGLRLIGPETGPGLGN